MLDTRTLHGDTGPFLLHFFFLPPPPLVSNTIRGYEITCPCDCQRAFFCGFRSRYRQPDCTTRLHLLWTGRAFASCLSFTLAVSRLRDLYDTYTHIRNGSLVSTFDPKRAVKRHDRHRSNEKSLKEFFQLRGHNVSRRRVEITFIIASGKCTTLINKIAINLCRIASMTFADCRIVPPLSPCESRVLRIILITADNLPFAAASTPSRT